LEELVRKLVVNIFVSLDGVMQGPGDPAEDREGGFTLGGWVVPHFDDKLGAHMVELVQGAGALLLGRKTYEEFAASWPNMPEGDPIAEIYNRIPRYVASRSPLTLEWANSHQLGEHVAAEIAELKEQEGGEIQVSGSSDLIQTLLGNDLVDVLHLVVFPTILGSGKRLFGDGTIPRGLKLVNTETTEPGVLILTYERIGDAQTAEFTPEFAETYR
jgi:dihydrofolate reductase